jgi:hypothetical protein
MTNPGITHRLVNEHGELVELPDVLGTRIRHQVLAGTSEAGKDEALKQFLAEFHVRWTARMPEASGARTSVAPSA